MKKAKTTSSAKLRSADSDSERDADAATGSEINSEIASEIMPNYRELEAYFKPAFIERYSQLTDFEAFKKCSLTFLRKSIRVNTLKITIDELQHRLEKDWMMQAIPWGPEGFWIERKGCRRDVGNLVEHALGYIYVQEAASMIPPVVLDPQPGEQILDLCASPGSKTTQIAQAMQNEGIIVANDINTIRMKALAFNIQRLGIRNIALNRGEGQQIRGNLFDRILVDAPCSATGTIRKSLKTLTMWNPHMIAGLAQTQKRLLSHAFSLLKKGGTIVYSTCSCEPEENEGVVSAFLEKHSDAEMLDIDLPLKRSPAITSFGGAVYHPDVRKCLRIWPQDNDTEGFFVAKMVKK